jgi:prefoldin beta subunit
MFQEMEALQDDAQSIARRRERLEATLEETQAALDALDDLDDDTTVYRRLGTVRVRGDPADLTTALDARRESLADCLADLDATEDDLREQFEQRKREIKHLVGAPVDGPTSQADVDD